MHDLLDRSVLACPEHLTPPCQPAADRRWGQLVHHVERHLLTEQLTGPEVVLNSVREAATELTEIVKADGVDLPRILRASPDRVGRPRKQRLRHAAIGAPLRTCL